MRKKTLVLGSCLGLLFLCGFQSPAAVGQGLQQEAEKEVDPCLKSTCRNAPLRENLIALDLRANRAIDIIEEFYRSRDYSYAELQQ